jgi:hypothetical protein
MTHKITVQSESNPAYEVEHIANMQEVEEGKWEGEVWDMHLSQVGQYLQINGVRLLSVEEKG